MQPLKITIEMKAPLILGDFPVTFDSVLAGLLAESEGLAIDQISDIKEIALPLKKTDDYYHASIMFWDKEEVFTSNIHKTFPSERMGDAQAQKVDLSRGANRNFDVLLTCLTTPYVYFYANGDAAEISKILKNLYRIGPKKTGWGRVGDIQVKEIPEDKSLYLRPGVPARPIPVKEPTGFTVICGYKPPYWLHENKALCTMPTPDMWQR
jgi:hypothetical protein